MTLFIGGFNDGRRDDFDWDLPEVRLLVWEAPHVTYLPEVSVATRNETYRRHTLRIDDAAFTFYVHESMTISDAMNLILAKYRA